jgi:hypothetical protein
LSYGGVTADTVRDLVHGAIFTRGPKDLHHTAKIEGYLRQIFPKVYTMSFENYPVEIERLRHAEVRSLNAPR